jgi:hypothetical protein
VLREIPEPDPQVLSPGSDKVELYPYAHNKVPQTPATPVIVESLASLLNLMKRIPNNEANRELRQKLHQKYINAT